MIRISIVASRCFTCACMPTVLGTYLCHRWNGQENGVRSSTSEITAAIRSRTSTLT